MPENTIIPTIKIDENVPFGYAKIGDALYKLPEAQTYTSVGSEPMGIDEIKRALEECKPIPKVKYPVFVEGEFRGFARFRGESLVIPVKEGESFFINLENPVEDISDEDKWKSMSYDSKEFWRDLSRL